MLISILRGRRGRTQAAGPLPVRQAGVELGGLAGAHRDVVLAEDQPHFSGEHVEPLVAGVGPQAAVALGRDHDLPHGRAARLVGQGIDEPPVPGAGPRPHARVADPRSADQFVERQVVRVGQGQQQLEARLALPALEP
jgi:hypothetical protein